MKIRKYLIELTDQERELILASANSIAQSVGFNPGRKAVGAAMHKLATELQKDPIESTVTESKFITNPNEN